MTKTIKRALSGWIPAVLMILCMGFPALTQAATRNAADQQFVNNADGFALGGGTTLRKLMVISGDVTLTGSGSGTSYTFPSAFSGNTVTLVGTAETQTLTNKTWAGNAITVPYGGTGATTLTGVVKGNGAAALTAMTGTADYVTRWADSSTLSTGVLFDNATNVGIGTASPAALLDVGGGTRSHADGSGGDMLVKSDIEADGNIYVDQNIYAYGTGVNYFAGHVGIGTGVPSKALSIVGTANILAGSGGAPLIIDQGNQTNVQSLIITNNGAGTTGIGIGPLSIGNNNDNDYQYDVANKSLSYRVRGNGAGAVPAHLFYMDATAAAVLKNVVQIKSDAAGADLLSLVQADNTEVFKVQYAGNTGIGAIKPAAKLEVDGAIYAAAGVPPSHSQVSLASAGNAMFGGNVEIDGLVYIDGALYGDGSHLTGISGSSTMIQDSTSSVNVKSGAATPINFIVNGSTSMVMDQNGNVGIGTVLPQSSLDVSGAIGIKGVNALSYPSSDTTAAGSVAIGSGALAGQTASAAYGNTAVGYQALNAVNYDAVAGDSINNTVLGYQAGKSVNTGYKNVLIGYQAAQSGTALTTGYQNVVVGHQATVGAIGQQSVVLGASAEAQATGSLAVGYFSRSNISGGIAVGPYSNTTGASGVGLGYSANPTGTNAMALGTSTVTAGNGSVALGGYSHAAGNYSMALGYQVYTPGQYSTIVGGYAAQSQSMDVNNTAVGYGALYNATTGGTDNTVLGYRAGTAITSGAYNIQIGSYSNTAGHQGIVTTGSNNILVGQDVGYGIVATSSNQMDIGNLIYATGVGSGVSGVSSGKVGIGTATPYGKFQVDGAIYAGTTAPSHTQTNLAASGNAMFGGNVEIDGFVYIDGVLYGDGAGLTGIPGTISSLTSGYVPKAASATTLANGTMYDDGTNVGIGVTNPNAKLQVNGDIVSSGSSDSYFNGNLGIGSTTPRGALDVAGDIYEGASGVTFATANPDLFVKGNIETDSAVYATGTGFNYFAGNVGIGTASPGQLLTVQGDANVNGHLYINGTSEYFYGSGAGQISVVGAFGTQNGIVINGSNLIGQGGLSVYGWNYGNNPFASGNDTGLSRYAEKVVAVGNGTASDYSGTLIASNAGIGTTAPFSKLQVDGAIYAGTIAPSHVQTSLNTSGNAMFGGNVEIDGLVYIDGALYGDGSHLTGISSAGNSTMITQNDTTVAVADGSSTPISFSIDGSKSMVLDSRGNVGIGTIAPLEKLEVSGSAQIDLYTAGAWTNYLKFYGGGSVMDGYINNYLGTVYLSDNAYYATGGNFYYGYQFNPAAQIALGSGAISLRVAPAAANPANWTTALIVNNTGYIGIGTTGPRALLEVSGSTTITGDTTIGPASTTYASSNADLFVKGNVETDSNIYATGTSANYFAGNVGIGTTLPSSLLDIFTSTASTSEANYSTLSLSAATSANGTGPLLSFKQNGIFRAGIAGEYTGAHAGDLVFFTHVNTGNDTWGNGILERMRIDNSGNVAIGTTTSRAVLEVSGSTTITGDTTIGPASITYASANADLFVKGNIETDSNIYASGSNANYFAGNVGIGTSTPGAKLEVSGSLLVGTASPSHAQTSLTTSGNAMFGGNVEIDGLVYIDGALYGDGSHLTGIGSATTPTMITQNDTTVAVADGSSTPISFSIDGSKAMVLDASGNVGIGTASPVFDIGPGVSLYSPNSDGPGIHMTNAGIQGNGGSGYNIEIWGGALLLHTYENTPIAFDTQDIDRLVVEGDGTITVEGGDFIVHSPGNVGIGTDNPGSNLEVKGSMGMAVVSKSADYTATASDRVILVNASGAPVTITLPAATAVAGRVYDIKKIDTSSNAVTVSGNGTNIDGSATVSTTTPYRSYTVISDGSNWWVL